MQIQRAIISVSDKTGVVDLAKGLAEIGIELLSTGGTAKALRDAGLRVADIAEYTGSPEILDGRLKTLHPKVHGGILGVRNNKKHQKEMAENSIKPIDMIVVNLYPFEETTAKQDCSLEDAVENIDIGGPAMLRAAAKNYRYVAVVADPADYAGVLSELRKNGGSISEETAFALAQKVFAVTARYDSAVCNYLNAVEGGEKRDVFPRYIGLTYDKVEDLRYGENPHQKAAFYKESCLSLWSRLRGGVCEPCVAGVEQLHGKELSYNNIMDADAAIEIVKEFGDKIFVAILKHTNPCGAAISEDSLVDAFNKARATDPVSAFGGIVGLNREVGGETADAIAEDFFEVVVAPDFSDGALRILEKKKNIRLLRLPGLGIEHSCSGWSTRKVVGGLLVQDRDLGVVDLGRCEVVSKRSPTKDEYKALDFAWKICKHVKSNAIVYASGNQLLGVGAGQMSRIDSVRIAHMKMEEMRQRLCSDISARQHVIVCASDAFFPFRDGIDAAAKAGATAVVQPGGSKRDEESVKAADEHDMAMIFTGMRHFRH